MSDPIPPDPAPADARDEAPDPGADERVRELEARLASRNEDVARLERRAQLDELLREAHVIDLDAARLLTEMTAAALDDADDLAAAVTELRTSKPWLFAPPAPPVRSASAPRVMRRPVDPIEDAATDAARTGARRDLLRYLRLRRSCA